MTIGAQVKQTLATLKGSEGTLKLYAMQTHDEESKQAYEEAIQVTQGIIKDLENRIKKIELEEPQYKGN
ncbi:protein of unknown function DUF1657 [Alkaliphilus metalliredigens QYMF]|uniref:DUF1657 domain-containing protein n=1 Tax=Alkaliphilus metalliredigens (strain QYMF) TaxID=293826 RepID=A6TVT9_ALKMQ|nr:DUF1657 domain-containing protein [Alkaliphilus metalliredigens]ABR50307.1 protein of unknown function DUF1657 [Alkaliphilus metalliredigens QYMF]